MTGSVDNRSIVILGGPNTGKSHYAYQLYGRLRVGGCDIELRRSPDSITLFEAGLERLNQGLAATHTTSNTYLECTLPLTVDGRSVDVCWPDYDGEQLYRQVTHRRIKKEWQHRLRSANAWLLFVRLTITKRHKDILADPLKTDIPTADDATGKDDVSSVNVGDLSGQAKVIELLQILLHATGTDVAQPTLWPTLGVVVSCWDEVCTEDGIMPHNLLATQAPLIHQFLESNWQAKSRFIVGLSSTGKPLSQDEPDEGYRTKGPESFGFSINVDGIRNNDLTLPISKLLELANSNES